MASTVDICNLAMSHFGQAANISSINPPDGSAEAEHCARFYPVALVEALEFHPWTFAKKHATLAELVNDRDDFAHAYALPADCVKPRRVLPEGYTDDENDGVEFDCEGGKLFTNAANATLVYTFKQVDPTKFSGPFVTGLSLKLAAYVAGPIVKEPSGRMQALLEQRAALKLSEAAASNGNSDRHRAVHRPTARRAR